VSVISMGTYEACALKRDQSVTCWPVSPLPAAGPYVGVSAGPEGYLLTPAAGDPQYYPPDPYYGTPPSDFYGAY